VPEGQAERDAGHSAGALKSPNPKQSRVPMMAVHVSRPATSRSAMGWWGRGGERYVEVPYEERLV